MFSARGEADRQQEGAGEEGQESHSTPRGIQLIQGAADRVVAIILSSVAVALYQGIRRALIAPISR